MDTIKTVGELKYALQLFAEDAPLVVLTSLPEGAYTIQSVGLTRTLFDPGTVVLYLE